MDSIQRFLFKDLNIRGQHLKITQAWAKLTENRGYPKALKTLFGELTAMTVMMANGMKNEGSVIMQVQGTGPVNLLVVEVSHDLKIKGVAKTNRELTNEQTPDELLGDGKILVTLENTQTETHYQSYIEREGNSLIESFEAFFNQSEQLPTKLWLASDDHSLAGVMIQKLPDTENSDADGWDRITHLSSTLTDEELCSLEVHDLLHRLFHEETIELFDAKPIQYHCPKEIDKIEAMIKGLGEEEVRQLLAEQGEIVINNDMCHFHVRLTQEDIDRIFKTSRQ